MHQDMFLFHGSTTPASKKIGAAGSLAARITSVSMLNEWKAIFTKVGWDQTDHATSQAFLLTFALYDPDNDPLGLGD